MVLRYFFGKIPVNQKRFEQAIHCFSDLGLWWCETPKVGCTSVRRLLLTFFEIEGAEITSAPHVLARKSLPNPSSMGQKAFISWAKGKGVRGYVFFRSPRERILSAYREKIGKPLESAKEHHQPYLRKLREDIVKWRHKKRSIDEVAPIDFVDFVDFCAHAPREKLDIHWRPQVDVTWFNYLPYSHVVPFEYFDQGAAMMMADLGASTSWIEAHVGVVANRSTRTDDSWEGVPVDLREKFDRRYQQDSRVHQRALRAYQQKFNV